MMKTHDKSALMEISQVFGTLSHVESQRVFHNDAFYRVLRRSFSQSVISETRQLWPSSFFSKCLKFDVDSRNQKKKIKKKVFAFQIIAFGQGVSNSRNIQQDTWQRQAMCQQIHLRFYLTLKETFSKPTSLKMMKNI